MTAFALTDGNPDAGCGLLSVIVPVRNERNTICETVRRLRTVPLPVEREIIVVNDASDDGTDKVLAALEDSTVRVVSHGSRRGNSAAFRTGIGVARGDILLFQDPHLRFTPEDWPGLLAPVLAGRTRVVFGSRFIGPGEAVSFKQWASDHVVGLCASLLFNRTVSDLDATKVIDRTALAESHLLRTRDGDARDAAHFDFNTELTARLLHRRQRIVEVPVSYASRDTPSRRRAVWRQRLARAWTLVRLRVRLAGTPG